MNTMDTNMNDDQLMALLTEINRDDKTSFLISTHDEKIANRCRRQIFMVDGRVADDQNGHRPLRD